MNRITAITPTLCRLMDIPAPAESAAGPLEEVLHAAKAVFAAGAVDRCLIYAPDCIGTQLIERWPGEFDAVRRVAPLAVPLLAVVPPKTPVCFGSMFTGADPAVHGIRKYEKPVLKCDTIFDALIRAGRKPAIVSVPRCSMDLIFRERQMDYFTEPDDQAVIVRALELLESGRHDFLICYQAGYDKCVHHVGPYGPEALEQVRQKVGNFERLSRKMDACWKGRRMIAFCPDHGNHADMTTGHGDHGLDIPQDMEVTHFFGFRGG